MREKFNTLVLNFAFFYTLIFWGVYIISEFITRIFSYPNSEYYPTNIVVKLIGFGNVSILMFIGFVCLLILGYAGGIASKDK